MRPLRLSSLLLALVLAGCVTTVSVPPAQHKAQATQARQLIQQGNYAQAAQAYLQLASQTPGQRGHYRLRAADAWRQARKPGQVAQVLARIHRGNLQPADVARYDLLQAELAFQHGNTQRVLTLTRTPAAGWPDDVQARALSLRAQALATSGRPWDAVHVRIQLDGVLAQGEAKARNARQLLKLLAAQGPTALKQRAMTLPADAPARSWIARTLHGLGAHVTGAAPVLTQPVGTLAPGSTLPKGYRLPPKVALILPFSGPLATYGNTVRQGFMASYFHANDHGVALPPIATYDTHGTPQGAVAAYQQAVAEGATVVVGPLTHAGVSAVIDDQPQLVAGHPAMLLALNEPSGGTLLPPNVTTFALSPEAEAAQAARYMYRQGLTKAIVMVSTESFAQQAAKAFITQFQNEGGSVVQSLTLDPAQVDYSAQIQSLGIEPVRPATLTKPLPPPTTGIFISMLPAQARLLMPQLHLAGILLPVFATPHVYGARANPVADGDLDGVTFSDAPWLFNAQPGLPSRAALAVALPAARGASARLFAFGMDAWSLVPYLHWLRTEPGSYLPGATGRLTEDAFGHVRRVLIWARFTNGIAQPLAGNLQMGMPTAVPAPATSSAPGLPAAASSSAAPAPAIVHP